MKKSREKKETILEFCKGKRSSEKANSEQHQKAESGRMRRSSCDSRVRRRSLDEQNCLSHWKTPSKICTTEVLSLSNSCFWIEIIQIEQNLSEENACEKESIKLGNILIQDIHGKNWKNNFEWSKTIVKIQVLFR